MDERERSKTICLWTDAAGKERVTYAGDPFTEDMPVEVRVFLLGQDYSAAYQEACITPRPALRPDA